MLKCYYIYIGGYALNNIKRKKRRKKKSKKILILILFLLIMLCSSIYVSSRFFNSSVNNHSVLSFFLKQNTTTSAGGTHNTASPSISPTSAVSVTTEPTKTVPDVEITLSSAGDCTIGMDDKTDLSLSLPGVFKKNNNDYSYFFKNVLDIFRNDDITTVNLETTFTNSSVKRDKGEGTQYNFKASPDYAKVLTAGSIEAVNISNNHIYDFGSVGFQDTINTLKTENINYFGEGSKLIKEVRGVKFGFLGYAAWSDDSSFLNKLKNDIQDLKSQNCIVIINFHWGVENAYTPNDIQKHIAHYAIDNGADLIIGHHPHVIESIEKYNNKIICYSLGNFCFGGNVNPYDKNTFIIQTKFKVHDDKLSSYGIKIIPCSISSVDYINDYCPTPSTGDKKADILKKLNELSINLGFELKDDFYFINCQ